MEELTKSIKAFLYDRSASPLFGAIIISALAWNYKVLMVVFSNLDVIQKFEEMNNLFTSNIGGLSSICGFVFATVPNTTKLINGLLIPISIALAYIFFYPSLGCEFTSWLI